MRIKFSSTSIGMALEMQAFKKLLDRVEINRFDIGIMVAKLWKSRTNLN